MCTLLKSCVGSFVSKLYLKKKKNDPFKINKGIFNSELILLDAFLMSIVFTMEIFGLFFL